MSYRVGRKRFRVKRAAFVIFLIGLALLGRMYHVATSDPIVRSTALNIKGLVTPVRLVLLSDIHVAGPDMPPSRVRRIVRQINVLRPDIVLIAGDFVSDKKLSTHQYSIEEAIAPLAELRARLAVIAVIGNHDHWRDAGSVRTQLARVGIRVLDNGAQRVGPITVGGVDDPFTGHDNLDLAVARMRSMPEPRILLSHSPDVFPRVPQDVILTVAGHTHCGQIRLPVIGALSTMSNYGERYACGRIDEHGRTLIVSSGLGTSLLPLRLGAPPDFWLIERRPEKVSV
jgi:predicted MPP superfamily phosphohydrolase